MIDKGNLEALRIKCGILISSGRLARVMNQYLLFIQLGKPDQNVFIERFNKSFGLEGLDAQPIQLDLESLGGRR